MRSILMLASALGLAANSGPSLAGESLRLKPSSKWVVHYAQDSCRLARSFGDDNNKVTLTIDRFSPGDWFTVGFIGNSLKARGSPRSVRGTLRFAPNESEGEVTGVMGTVEGPAVLLIDGNRRLAPLTKAEEAAIAKAYRLGIPFDPEPISEAREGAVTRIELKKALRTDLILDTGPMDKPLATLRDCSWDKVAAWGLNVDQQKTLKRRPVPKPASTPWLRADDYPDEMVHRRSEGIVHYRLMVDVQGRPTSCHIQASTSPKEFGEAVCRAMMSRARFHPALDAKGAPVPSYWTQPVQFKLH